MRFEPQNAIKNGKIQEAPEGSSRAPKSSPAAAFQPFPVVQTVQRVPIDELDMIQCQTPARKPCGGKSRVPTFGH